MVSKEEINQNIWRGKIVSEAALSSRIKSARKALGDSGQAQHYIRTIHKKGFRFFAEVKVVRFVNSQQEMNQTNSDKVDFDHATVSEHVPENHGGDSSTKRTNDRKDEKLTGRY